jgi:DNA-binding CsgD family transcriptional regulator
VILVSAAGAATEDALVLHLCALPATAGLAVRGRILAFLSPVSRPLQARIASRILQLAFDLTPAEATVTLALREHHDPLHVALELGLAISTVRSHLKHVFAKTGTGSQRALLRLVDCLLAGVRD